MNKKKIIIVISWLLVIIWMGIIFWFSDMNTNESNSKSKNTITNVIESTVDTTNKLGITDKHPSEEKKQEVTNKLNEPLRKGMHASVYLVLAILLMNALIVSNAKLWLAIILSIIISFAYACSDEYHQTFVEGRSGKFTDVLIDTTGALVGSGIYYLGYYIFKKVK